jgi:hypothetical protein
MHPNVAHERRTREVAAAAEKRGVSGVTTADSALGSILSTGNHHGPGTMLVFGQMFATGGELFGYWDSCRWWG